MITDKQIQNINNLSFDDKATIVREIFEGIGAVCVDDYAKINGINRRSVYRGMDENRIVFIEVLGKKIPCVNETINRRMLKT